MNFSVTAPGKIILAGEHAVVYGYKGVASSINLRCEAIVRIPKENNKIVSLHLENIPFDFEINEIEYNMLLFNVGKHRFDATSQVYQSIMKDFLDEKIHESLRDDQFIYQGLLVFMDLCLTLLTNCWQAVDITVNSEFSYGCGLGSSAAYATVLATVFMIIRGDCETWELSMPQLKTVSSLSFRGEQIVHGTPSGIDNCISTFGGALLFQRKEDSVVRMPVATPHLPVLLVDTHVKRCTKTVVQHVQKLVVSSPDKYHAYFLAMNDIVVQLAAQLVNDSANMPEELSRLVGENQTLLRSLDVSHEAIDEAVALLASQGIAAKLTGAGRGGCVFAFLAGVPEAAVTEATIQLVDRGFGVRLTHLSCPGVRVEPIQE